MKGIHKSEKEKEGERERKEERLKEGNRKYLGNEHLFCHLQDIRTISHTNTAKRFTQTALL